MIRGALSAGSGIENVDLNKPGAKSTFVSNALLIKLTQQAAPNLKIIGEDVNPAALGVRKTYRRY